MMKQSYFNPLISVIVPIYNVEPYIEKCIDSIVKQTYSNLEIILVDDGSDDASLQICNAYLQKDSRIKVIHKSNGGLVSARKAGIKIAGGVYATYVDGDDWIDQDMYENMIKEIDYADIIICGVRRDYGENFSLEINKIDSGSYFGQELEDKVFKKMIYTGRFFERGIQPHLINILSRTKLLKSSQMAVSDEIRVGEDAACLYPLLMQCKKVKIISQCYYHYRMREDSIMGVNEGDELKKYKILYSSLKKGVSYLSNLENDMLYQLDYFMIYSLLLKEMRVFQSDKNSIFPYSGIEQGKRIAIYGRGRFGCELIRYLKDRNRNQIVLWVDKNCKEGLGKVDRLIEMEYDYVLVAVLIRDIIDDIVGDILSMGIPKEKIKVVDKKLVDEKRKYLDDILRI